MSLVLVLQWCGFPLYMYTAVLSWTPQLWCSRMSAVYACESSTNYLKCSLLRLHNPLSCYLTPKNVHRFNIVQIWPLLNSNLNILLVTWVMSLNFGPWRSAEQVVEQTKKGYIHVIQASGCLEGQWELTSKLPPEIHVFDGIFFEIGNRVPKVLVFWFRLFFSPLCLDILKTFCTVSNDSFLAVNSSIIRVHTAGYLTWRWYSVYNTQSGKGKD